MRGGIMGVNDPDQYNKVFDHAPDLHLQFIQFLDGGDLPLPQGYRQPNICPPRPHLQLRSLPFPLPSRNEQEGGDSSMAPQISVEASSRPGSRPVIVPENLGDEFKIYIGAANLTNLSNQLQAPPSPGPTMTLYNVSGPIDISQALQYPVGDPERADATLVKRPPPRHPNPVAQPALQTIRLFSPSDPGSIPTVGCEELKEGGICDRNTKTTCKDLTHDLSKPVPMPICADCNQASRVYFETAVCLTVEILRAYACNPCAAQAATNSATFQAQNFHVWGLNSAGPPSTPEEYASHNRCRPLPITGCACATKILDGTLCGPHRLEYVLNMRSKADKMREYFQSEPGVASAHVAYACLSCLSIVVLDAAAHETMAQELQSSIEELEK
ncbi:hypothetical protein F5B18DRAFT_671495 [Nemania serpens]|nr:hypothetical protein F5B18DRAFT_671495 [Nemania serpens]